jgi:hypothetical protein
MKSTGCVQLDGLRFAALPRTIETWMTFSELAPFVFGSWVMGGGKDACAPTRLELAASDGVQVRWMDGGGARLVM